MTAFQNTCLPITGQRTSYNIYWKPLKGPKGPQVLQMTVIKANMVGGGEVREYTKMFERTSVLPSKRGQHNKTKHEMNRYTQCVTDRWQTDRMAQRDVIPASACVHTWQEGEHVCFGSLHFLNYLCPPCRLHHCLTPKWHSEIKSFINHTLLLNGWNIRSYQRLAMDCQFHT